MTTGRGDDADRVGPGSKVIATTLLEWLAVRGRVAARDRAERALGLDAAELGPRSVWLPEGSIEAMVLAAEIGPGAARAIGHRLVAPDATGLRLYRLGLATPEKAYRRAQSLLPREALGAHWSVESIADRTAVLCHAPAAAPRRPGSAPRTPAMARRAAATLCALRVGLLEAVPGLYGLLPAEVECTRCMGDGADACRYVVRWTGAPRRHLHVGLAIGGGLAAGLVGSAIWLATPGAAFLVGAGATLLIAPAIGWVLDLRDQLEAVAGARRGHLALFDQVDDALAEKLDSLARAEASVATDAAPSPVRRPSGDDESEGGAGPSPNADEIVSAAQRIHSAAGELECWLEKEAGGAKGTGLRVDDERARIREIREDAARIATLGSLTGEGVRSVTDLRRLVERAVAAARPVLPGSVDFEIEAEADLRAVRCDVLQIEHVVIQLLQNAAEASIGLCATPRVDIGLRNVARGVELSVEDRGVGIDATEIDEVFDPFFGERPAGVDGGLGLPVCLRIIERHGGELRFESEDRAGTRVSILLPWEPSPEAGEGAGHEARGGDG